MSEPLSEIGIGEGASVAAPSVGEQLRAAREARSLSVSDVAQALKLGVRQVEALESGNWGGLPGNTFIRGFARNYARLVQLDGALLMSQLDGLPEPATDGLELPAAKPATMPVAGGPGRSHDFAVVLFGAGLVILAAAIYFLMPGGLADLQVAFKSVASVVRSEESAEPVPAAAPSESVMPPGATTQQVLNPQAQLAPEQVPLSIEQPAPRETTALPMPAPTPTPGAAAASNSAAGGVPLLRLVFDKESWVEVRDRNSKVLFSQRGTQGNDVAVEGEGPLSIVVGYAPGVRLQLRGQPVDLTPYSRGDVARLTLD